MRLLRPVIATAKESEETRANNAGPANQRFIVQLEDGAEVEAVVYRDDTLCISSQVGCAVGCPFCASGANGLGRPLTEAELRFQVESVEQRLGVTMQRITLSGVGEPLHNHARTWAFMDWARTRNLRVSLTTSGGPIRHLRTWLGAPHNGLTLSVHAGTEETRARVVPQGPSLEELFQCLGEVLPTLTRKRRKKTALAYLLVKGLNDEDAELDAFAARVGALPPMTPAPTVHIYDHNPVPTSPLQGVSRTRYEAAYERLSHHGLKVRMSSQARLEANGGCGTLVALRHKRSR